MSAKIVCRIRKVRANSTSHQSDRLLAHVEAVLRSASDILSGRWHQVRSKESRPLDSGKLAKLDTAQDTSMSLPLLDQYINSMNKRPNTNASKAVAPTASLVHCDASTLPTLSEKNCTDYHRMTANLQQFEHWISLNMDSWLDSRPLNACLKLHDLSIQYHGLAKFTMQTIRRGFPSCY
jgi:hypothetical protein